MLFSVSGSISFKIDDISERELVFEGGRLCGAHDLAQVADEECSMWSNGSNIAPLDKDVSTLQWTIINAILRIMLTFVNICLSTKRQYFRYLIH